LKIAKSSVKIDSKNKNGIETPEKKKVEDEEE